VRHISVSLTSKTEPSAAGEGVTEALLRGVRALLAVIRVLSGVLLVLSVALNFANVVGRYFFNASIPWAEEAMLFLMVGCVFLGNGVVAWSGRQIRMDVIVNLMPAKVRAALDLFSELVLIATAITIVIFAWPVIRDLAAFDQRSQAADFPLVIPQAMVPIGLSIMALLVAVRLITSNRRAPPGGVSH
jgi:TRAP-type C4-dicarboxylate transport system permease small subunit